MLTENKFLSYKGDFLVHKKQVVVDEYRNTSAVYDDEHVFTLHNIMITPVSNTEVIEAYGDKVVGMKQFVLYTSESIGYGDRVIIADGAYEVVQIMQYQTHREIVLLRV